MCIITSSIVKFYLKSGFTDSKKNEIYQKIKSKHDDVKSLETELCYYVEVDRSLQQADIEILKWLLREPKNPNSISQKENITEASGHLLIEVGPRFNFSTAFSTNAVSICNQLGLKQVKRIEVSRRYSLTFATKTKISVTEENDLVALLHDRMTECRYTNENVPKRSFGEKLVKKEDIREVDVLNRGRAALEEISKEMGFSFDDADFEYYTNLFKNVVKRNPTNIECFDLAQSNSEHSRHWFFKGKMIIDGVEHEDSLIDMIIRTQETSNPNNVIKFSDNSRLQMVLDRKNYYEYEENSDFYRECTTGA